MVKILAKIERFESIELQKLEELNCKIRNELSKKSFLEDQSSEEENSGKNLKSMKKLSSYLLEYSSKMLASKPILFAIQLTNRRLLQFKFWRSQSQNFKLKLEIDNLKTELANKQEY